jgi:site-specific DNA-methyltransferase (adenine-specific)
MGFTLHQYKLKIHTSSKSNELETPKDFFKKYDDIYHFENDVASTHENRLVENYWTIEDDALSKDWNKMVCWMNPPYGREIGKFVKKSIRRKFKRCNSSLFNT